MTLINIEINIIYLFSNPRIRIFYTLFGLGPKIDVPMRTKVAPSSMAASKSVLVPMESSSQVWSG
jgi:hypothetical protein